MSTASNSVGKKSFVFALLGVVTALGLVFSIISGGVAATASSSTDATMCFPDTPKEAEQAGQTFDVACTPQWVNGSDAEIREGINDSILNNPFVGDPVASYLHTKGVPTSTRLEGFFKTSDSDFLVAVNDSLHFFLYNDGEYYEMSSGIVSFLNQFNFEVVEADVFDQFAANPFMTPHSGIIVLDDHTAETAKCGHFYGKVGKVELDLYVKLTCGVQIVNKADELNITTTTSQAVYQQAATSAPTGGGQPSGGGTGGGGNTGGGGDQPGGDTPQPGPGPNPEPQKPQKDPTKNPSGGNDVPGTNEWTGGNGNYSTADQSTNSNHMTEEEYNQAIEQNQQANDQANQQTPDNRPTTPPPSSDSNVDSNANQGTGNGGVNDPTPVAPLPSELSTNSSSGGGGSSGGSDSGGGSSGGSSGGGSSTPEVNDDSWGGFEGFF